MLNRCLLKKPLAWLWLSFLIIALDQVSKYWANQALFLGHPHPVLPFLNFTLSYNPGAAFSFLGGATGWQVYVFIAITLVISLILLRWLLRLAPADRLTGFALALLLGGAIGNLIDRIRLHYVIDFIDFHLHTWHYATFNLADSAVCVGVFLLVLRTLKKEISPA